MDSCSVYLVLWKNRHYNDQLLWAVSKIVWLFDDFFRLIPVRTSFRSIKSEFC